MALENGVAQKQRRQLKRRVIAFVVLHVLILAHLAAWYLLDWRLIGAIDMQELFRNAIERNIWTAGALFFLALIALTLLWGRIFCGWWCHIGQAYDLIASGYRKLRVPMGSVPLRFGWVMASVVLIWFFLREAIAHRVSGPAAALSVELGATEPWELLPGWVNGTITLGVVLFALPILLGPRTFCRSLCPWGVVLGAANRVSRYKVRRTGDCTLCGACSPACPMDIDVSREINTGDLSVSRLTCTNCMQCVAACPTDALSFSPPGQRHQQGPNPPFPPGPPFPAIGVELLFWAMVCVVGFVYSELYGIGIFLAFSLGLVLARLTWVVIARLRKQRALPILGAATLLAIVWLGVAKDGVAKYCFASGFSALRAGDPSQARDYFETSDRLFWVTPDVLLLNLNRVYGATGEVEKQRRNAERFNERQRRRGRL